MAGKHKPNGPDGLTELQINFIREYIANGNNATQAAISAGYSAKTASKLGHDLLNHPKVIEEIGKHRKKVEYKYDLSQDRIVQELVRIAFGNMSNLVKWCNSGVELYDSKTLSEDITASVNEVSDTQTENSSTRKVKMHDKIKALELLMKYQGMLDGRGNKAPSDTGVKARLLDSLRKFTGSGSQGSGQGPVS